MTDELSHLVLPELPNKRYFSTSDVARLCQLKPHVLRYWEKEFPSLQPNRKKGGQRYYQYNDVVLVCFIQYLVHEQNYSLNYAKQYIRQYGKTNIVQQILAYQKSEDVSDSHNQNYEADQMLESIKQDIKSLLEQLKQH